MIRHIAGILLAATFGTSAYAGVAEGFFSERAKDFGVVQYGPILEHKIKITNTTPQIVTITNARVSCGCVAATIPQAVLQPGQSTTVNLTMDTKRFLGQKQVTVYIQFGNPREEVTLLVSANRNDSFTKSGEAISIGQVRKGQSGTSALTVTMRNDASFQIVGANSNTDFVKPEFRQIKRDHAETVYEISATMKPGLDVGVWATDVVFLTSNGTTPTLRFPVYAEVVAPITVTPSTVQFPAVKIGDKKEMSVVVKGDKPFKIVDVTGGDSLISAKAESTDSKLAHIVRLVFQPSAAGDMAKEITVVTDSGSMGKVTIPVRGKAKSE
jgi:Protein of unknown function (DUF1573)